MVEDVAEKYLRKLKKVMSVWPDFFSNFQWIHWSEMTVLYLYLMVWGVMEWAFSISGSNCSHTVVLCHFPCFFAQLSPPSSQCFYQKKYHWRRNLFSFCIKTRNLYLTWYPTGCQHNADQVSTTHLFQLICNWSFGNFPPCHWNWILIFKGDMIDNNFRKS